MRHSPYFKGLMHRSAFSSAKSSDSVWLDSQRAWAGAGAPFRPQHLGPCAISLTWGDGSWPQQIWLIPLEFVLTQHWNLPSWKCSRSDISLSPLPAISASSSPDCDLQFHCGPQGQQAPFYTQPCAYLGERTLSTTIESRTTSEFQ